MFRTLFLATAASGALLACASDADMGGDSTVSAMSADMTPEDRTNYVKMAASSDMFEVQSSQLALSRAQNADVRTFAQMMIDHHSQTTEQLRTAAKAAGLLRTHDWMLPPPMQRMMEELQAASASDFDRLYMRQQVQAHEMALALHSNYARKGDTAALRVVATAATPIVQRHLDRARELD